MMRVPSVVAARSWRARSSGISIYSTRANGACHFPFGVATPSGLPLVVQLFALAERQRHLRYSVAEVELERNERQPLPFDGSDETTDFLAMEQQLARSLGFVVRITAPFIGRDVHVDEEDLAIANDSVRVSNVGFAVPERFHLSAGENDAGLPRIEDLVIKSRALVARDRDLVGRSLGVLGHRRWPGLARRRRRASDAKARREIRPRNEAEQHTPR